MKQKNKSTWMISATFKDKEYDWLDYDEISFFTGTANQHIKHVNELYKKGAVAVVSELTN